MDWDLIGHQWAVDLLRRQLEQGSLHHAILITGPTGVGRRSLALALARTLLCLERPGAGLWCGACRACRQVPAGTYPDLHLVERLEAKKGVSIEQIRELQRSLALTPLDGQARVAVLTEFDAASEGAANALLKTLEEPPPRVTLVLTASDVEDVPPTIASRCELIALRPVPEGEIAAALEGLGASAELGRDLARMAVGRPRWAQELLADPARCERRQALAAALAHTLRLDLAGRFALAEEWADEDDLEERLSLWLLQLGDSARSEAGRSYAGDLGSARSAIDAVMGTLQALRRNANARLALETMMLDLPSGGKLGPLAHPTTGVSGGRAGRSDR